MSARRSSTDLCSAYTETEKSEKTNMKMTGVKYVATVIQTMALFLLGSVLVTNGTITVGTMIAFITLSSYINDPFSMMDYMISTMKARLGHGATHLRGAGYSRRKSGHG